MAYGYIYYTKNEVNGKMYIGKITARSLANHPNYKGSGIELQKALEKYGTKNFTTHFLAAAQSSEELTFLEKYYLIYYKIPNEKFYNVNLATSNSEQSTYYNKNNTHGANLKNIICYNIKTGEQTVFNNITQFCAEHGFSRGCLFNVISGQRITHKDCIFWYKDYPISSDAINWILNYKNKTNYETKYVRIDEVKAELNLKYKQANHKLESFVFNGYYIEDGKELTIDWEALKNEHSSLLLKDGLVPQGEKKIENLEINTTQDSKFEDYRRDFTYILADGERQLYFNYDEINNLTKLYPEINPRLLRQAINRKQQTVMNKKFQIFYQGA